MGCANSKRLKEKVAFLQEVPLFQRLSQESIEALAAKAHRAEYRPGHVIVRQGDIGDEFFIIEDGVAAVIVDGKKVSTLKARDYFGEACLKEDHPRNATVMPIQHITALKITRDNFDALNLSSQLKVPKRVAIQGAATRHVERLPPSPKTEVQIKRMHQALAANKSLQEFVTLDAVVRNNLIEKAWLQDVPAEEELIVQGSLNADYFYIVEAGQFTILEKGREEPIGKLGPGESFGELALLYFAPRAATVRADFDSKVWVIDRNHFKEMLHEHFAEQLKGYAKYLHTVELFQEVDEDTMLEVAKACVEMKFDKGETIFEEGEQGVMLYLLIEGAVDVVQGGKVISNLNVKKGEMKVFGERALMSSDPRAATITAVSFVKVLTLDRESFDMLMAPSKGNLDGEHRPGSIQLSDLKRMGLLGCGGFGAVYLVQDMRPGKGKEAYALKSLSKGYIVKAGMQQSVMSEKAVQLMCNSVFIVKLYEAYNGSQELFFLLELALGGELFATYHKHGFFRKVKHAQFYCAGALLAFEHMHALKILYRDLKPENLLLTDTGRVKLTDMGLAKITPGLSYTTCGTPDYFAPEMLGSEGHNKAVDWWTLGILMYELMVGNPPFESGSPAETYRKIKRGIQFAEFPQYLRGAGKDLISDLCQPCPQDRLPMTKSGPNGVKKHGWYKGFKWDEFADLTMEPPYVPDVDGPFDSRNFTATEASLPPQIPYIDDATHWDAAFATT
eukprot:TRINITY_DN1767_c1_g1_i1.p1 TRINITY_DN1767_c1_g1~~TRINITY_DN1767_c1_g1_i1.p1  ORF type:complete len:762 (-),score=175.32 TRINITY_DN1767_c1_g1_i1:83-2272(-)